MFRPRPSHIVAPRAIPKRTFRAWTYKGRIWAEPENGSLLNVSNANSISLCGKYIRIEYPQKTYEFPYPTNETAEDNYKVLTKLLNTSVESLHGSWYIDNRDKSFDSE